jgi:hypothetical protein
VVVYNFNVVRIAISPDEAQPPLIVDPDAVLPCPVADQCLQAVRRRLAEIFEPSRRRQYAKFASGHLCQVAREALRHPIIPNRRGALICKGPDHIVIRSAYHHRIQAVEMDLLLVIRLVLGWF